MASKFELIHIWVGTSKFTKIAYKALIKQYEIIMTIRNWTWVVIGFTHTLTCGYIIS